MRQSWPDSSNNLAPVVNRVEERLWGEDVAERLSPMQPQDVQEECPNDANAVVDQVINTTQYIVIMNT
jgi:hypothetical protein